jgi:HAMP domain-containing protein
VVHRSAPLPRWALPRLRWRLRHKLGLSLTVAALLPVLVVSWVAGSVLLRSLDSNLRGDAQRLLHIGLKLVRRDLDRLASTAVRIATSAALRNDLDAPAVVNLVAEHTREWPSALVLVLAADGAVKVRHGAAAGRERLAAEAARDLEAFAVELVSAEGRLWAAAAAPVLEGGLLRGRILLLLPVDRSFAERVKSSLGADVFIGPLAVTGALPVVGTTAPIEPGAAAPGAPAAALALPGDFLAAVRRGGSVYRDHSTADRSHALSGAPLFDRSGRIAGLFAVAIDRAPLSSARRAATRSLALGAAGAFLFALGLAGLLSRRIVEPIARLHQGALAIARGERGHRIEVSEGDEIGDLAVAFARMTEALRAAQEELEAKVQTRTTELTAANAELERTVRELRDTQAQLVLSERLAGLGQLVAGVAHEVNSPSAAIRGCVDTLEDCILRFTRHAQELAVLPLGEGERRSFVALVLELAPTLAQRRLPPPAQSRRRGRADRGRGERGGECRARRCAVELRRRADCGRPAPAGGRRRAGADPARPGTGGISHRVRRAAPQRVHREGGDRSHPAPGACAQELLAPRPGGGGHRLRSARGAR